jgi:hypothetical protein
MPWAQFLNELATAPPDKAKKRRQSINDFEGGGARIAEFKRSGLPSKILVWL